MATSVLPPMDFLFPSRGRAQIGHLWVSVCGGVHPPSRLVLSSSCHSRSAWGPASVPFLKSILDIFPQRRDSVSLNSNHGLSALNSFKKLNPSSF